MALLDRPELDGEDDRVILRELLDQARARVRALLGETQAEGSDQVADERRLEQLAATIVDEQQRKARNTTDTPSLADPEKAVEFLRAHLIGAGSLEPWMLNPNVQDIVVKASELQRGPDYCRQGGKPAVHGTCARRTGRCDRCAGTSWWPTTIRAVGLQPRGLVRRRRPELGPGLRAPAGIRRCASRRGWRSQHSSESRRPTAPYLGGSGLLNPTRMQENSSSCSGKTRSRMLSARRLASPIWSTTPQRKRVTELQNRFVQHVRRSASADTYTSAISQASLRSVVAVDKFEHPCQSAARISRVSWWSDRSAWSDGRYAEHQRGCGHPRFDGCRRRRRWLRAVPAGN